MSVNPEHPISHGVRQPVEAFDELYYNMRFHKDRSRVLDLVTGVPTRENMRHYINLWNKHGVEGHGKRQTLMWGFERDNGGRGVGFTGGHYHRNWALDNYRTMVLNAIAWTAKIEIPKGGIRSSPLTEDDLNANLDKYNKPTPRIPFPDVEKWRNKGQHQPGIKSLTFHIPTHFP